MKAEHSAHCRACKERVRELLTAIYGDCRTHHQFPWPAGPEDYANTVIGHSLERIRRALGEWRGHRDFIRSAFMPPCDFYVSTPPFIVEFDESQHFTRARLITLSLYPEMALGFSIPRWQELCREVDAQDDQPFDRDERRAWYDTLRDLVPAVHGFEPTIRLYAAQYPWCSLDTGSVAGPEQFGALLRNLPPHANPGKDK
ncbi:MAG: hypothetical protein ACREQ2_24920 [Candidatus Binatia bacterium]